MLQGDKGGGQFPPNYGVNAYNMSTGMNLAQQQSRQPGPPSMPLSRTTNTSMQPMLNMSQENGHLMHAPPHSHGLSRSGSYPASQPAQQQLGGASGMYSSNSNAPLGLQRNQSDGSIPFDTNNFPMLSTSSSRYLSSASSSSSHTPQSSLSHLHGPGDDDYQKDDFPSLRMASQKNDLSSLQSLGSNGLSGSGSIGSSGVLGMDRLRGVPLSAVVGDSNSQLLNHSIIGSVGSSPSSSASLGVVGSVRGSQHIGVPGGDSDSRIGGNMSSIIGGSSYNSGIGGMVQQQGLGGGSKGLAGDGTSPSPPPPPPPGTAAPNRDAKYGLTGLLDVIRNTDKDMNTLALGADLTTFGLNLNSTECLYSTFSSPFADQAAAMEPQYSTPSCYIMRSPSIKPDNLAKFQIETLFYMFYSMPRDILQAAAAQELYRREWRYHTELRLWLKHRPPQEMLQSHPGAQFLYFDVNAWEARLFTSSFRGNITLGLLREEDIRLGSGGM